MADDDALFQNKRQQNVMQRSPNYQRAKSNIISLLYKLSQVSNLARSEENTVLFLEITVKYGVICGLD
jgi:hypothetical protein